jgi:arsenite methyltransferase
MADEAAMHATATGHALSDAAWLDLHFERSRAIYEAMAQAVGLEAGWRVLDAGCGSGSFLPTLAALVGPTGALTALDYDAENVATAERRVAAAPLACPVAFRQGSVTALPFPDGSFDAVWCANVSQYLTDAEILVALAECRRVARPGGLVAFKESDGLSDTFWPMDPAVHQRLYDACVRGNLMEGPGVVRAAALRRWLERAGLTDVRQQLFPEEYWAPLSPAERAGAGGMLRYLAVGSEAADIPEGDRAFWRAQADPAHPAALVNHPEFYKRGGYVLAVGTRATDAIARRQERLEDRPLAV